VLRYDTAAASSAAAAAVLVAAVIHSMVCMPRVWYLTRATIPVSKHPSCPPPLILQFLPSTPLTFLLARQAQQLRTCSSSQGLLQGMHEADQGVLQPEGENKCDVHTCELRKACCKKAQAHRGA